MIFVRALLIFISLAPLFPLAASAQQTRPYSGCGVVIIRALSPDRPADATPITLYRDPGVARIAEISVGKIPRLSVILKMPAGECPLAVMGKKGNWLRIAYDDAGREGWVELERWWDYITWDDFLKGRFARLLPGLKKTAYMLYAGPAETAHQAGTLSGLESLKIIEVADNWALVIVDSGLSGWLPWRDDDGRFQIAVDENSGTQKH